MHRYYFYVSPEQVNEKTATVTGDDFRHCIQVLRKKVGDKISLIDGKGNVFQTVVQEVMKTGCTCRILSREKRQKALKTDIILGFGIVKTKATESIIRNAAALGVARINPLKTVHSVKQEIKSDRIHKIAVESIKQSGNVYLPEIEEPQHLSQWLAETTQTDVKLVCLLGSKAPLNKSLTIDNSIDSIAILIGPEGGLHNNEVQKALETGFRPVTLSPFRLRTELAAINVVSGVNSIIN